jgi:hypothetical protein
LAPIIGWVGPIHDLSKRRPPVAFRRTTAPPISAVRRIAMRWSALSTQIADRTMSIWPRSSPTTFVHNLGSRLRWQFAALSAFQSQRHDSLRFEVSGDVFRMPAEDYVNFGMLLQFFERVHPSRVQQPILRLRVVDPSCYQ